MKRFYVEQAIFVTGVFEGDAAFPNDYKKASKDWFNPVRYLGKKGYKYYSESLRYVLAAASKLMIRDIAGSEKVGVFIGTDSADVESRKEIMENLKAGNDVLIGAASAPNCSVNIAAGTMAQKYQFKGCSFTFTGPEDAALMALWKAQKCLGSDQLEVAIVGQVEYINDQPQKSGAILWKISSSDMGESSVEVQNFQCQRWVGSPDEIDRWLPVIDDAPIYILGKDSLFLKALSSNLEFKGHSFKHLVNDLIRKNLSSDLYLYSMLSFLILKKISGNIFVVSSKGHVYFLKLKC